MVRDGLKNGGTRDFDEGKQRRQEKRHITIKRGDKVTNEITDEMKGDKLEQRREAMVKSDGD